MSTITITRVKCDGCSYTVDDNDRNLERGTWMRLVTQPLGGTFKTLDLCPKCNDTFAKRCAEVWIKL